MTVTKSKYWGVMCTFKNDILFQGTFVECWDYMMKNWSDITLKQLQIRGVKIARVK